MPRESIGPPREGTYLPSGPIVSIRSLSLQADALLQSLAHLEPMRNDDVRRCTTQHGMHNLQLVSDGMRQHTTDIIVQRTTGDMPHRSNTPRCVA
jgi:hypothetical protein